MYIYVGPQDNYYKVMLNYFFAKHRIQLNNFYMIYCKNLTRAQKQAKQIDK